MAAPVCWTKLIWKPLPVGQPEEGPFTVVVLEEVETSCFKTMLTLGDDAMLTKEMVKLLGSVVTVFQLTV